MPAATTVIAELPEAQELHRSRPAQVVLALAGKYTDARLEAARPRDPRPGADAGAGRPAITVSAQVLTAPLKELIRTAAREGNESAIRLLTA